MDEQPVAPHSPQFRLLLGTALATTVIVSLGWAVAWRNLNRLHRADYERFERRLGQLDTQLDDQLATMRELLKEYAGSQDARIALESRLAAAETALERARADVESFQSGDWESRFHGEQRRADTLNEAVAGLERQVAELQQIGERGAADAKAVKKQKSELAAAKDEIDKLRRQLAHFTSQRQPAAGADAGGYRSSRLESLRAAMSGRSSAERVPILQGVVPAIPGGIGAGELAGLMQGMDSADVRATIGALRSHLKPLDQDGTATLLGLMGEGDAAAVAELLASEAATAEETSPQQ